MNDINPDNPDGVLPELEPLHKVLPAGGPILAPRVCTRCGLLLVNGKPPENCPATEEQIGACPLRATQ